ncbi:hypothetical protein OV203_05775 [Nannocystis sp. ILAH1]|uniref:DUF2383 domain-containing protein n=1 Tax=Nannocystis sp. ILAH1 TaxID=2996789 RepID=UPI0022700B72|nr:DUF2383 domain-containing protein [Nannocystis sp. ILAH1]MCY0986618.1 hypothetical protein [Nannocystis sp. ILAH1]
MSQPSEAQDTLVTLYRGEAAAAEAYDRALKKFAGQPEEPILKEIRAEHREAMKHLELELRRNGIVAPEGPGPWGVVFNALGSLTALVNDEVPLQMLQHGEEVGIEEHERALASGSFSPNVTRRIRESRNRCEQHRERLQNLRDVITTQPNRPMI